MAKIPEYPDKLVTTEAPKSDVSARTLLGPYQQRAAAIGDLGEAIETAGLAAQEEAGAKAVTMDAEGNPQVESRLVLSRSDAAYNRGAAVAFSAQTEMNIRERVNALGNDFANDPVGFRRAANAYRASLLGRANGEQYVATQRLADAAISEKASGLGVAKQRRDSAIQKDTLEAGMASTGLYLQNLARQGGLDTPQAREALERYDGYSAELAANPLIAKSTASVMLERERFRAKLQEEQIVGKVERDYATDPAAAEKYAKEAFADQNLALTPEERLAGQRRAMQSFETQTVGARLASAEHRARIVSPLVQLLTTTRADVPMAQWTAARERAIELKDWPSVWQLDEAKSIRDTIGPGGQPFGSSSAPPALQGIIKGAAARHGVPESYLLRTAQIESAFDPEANRLNKRSAKGLYQFIPETAAQYGLGDRFDPAASADAAARLARDNRDSLRMALGREPTDGELYLAHQQGAGGAAQLLLRANDPAWQVVGRERVQQNLPDSMKGRAASMTAAEFAAVWTGRFDGPAPAGGYVSPSIIKARYDAAKSRLPSMIADSRELVTTNRGLDDTALLMLGQYAAMVNEPGLTNDVVEIVAANEALQVGRATENRADPRVTQMVRDRLATPGAMGDPVVQMHVAKFYEQGETARQKALGEDPIGLGVQKGYLKPGGVLDWSSPASRAATMERRSAELGMVEAMEGGAPASVFRPAEKQAFVSAMAGSAESAGAAMAALADAPDKHLVASLKDVKESVLSAARSPDPQKHAAIMPVMDALWQRAPQSVGDMIGGDGLKLLQDWQASHRYLTEEQLAERLNKRDDPQVVQRRKALEVDGRALARKKPMAEILGGFDDSMWVRDPAAPIDPETRDVLLADYERLYGQRYAETLDEGTAHTQAMESLRRAWGRSDVNGGRITLYPPETAYKPVNGSHEWMKIQLDGDLKTRLGAVPERYTIVGDRKTEAAIRAGKPASYLIVTVDANGRSDVVRDADRAPLRYSWTPDETRTDAREDFAEQRRRLIEGPGRRTPRQAWGEALRSYSESFDAVRPGD